MKLSNTIAQDGPKLKGVVQGYAGPKNPFGRSDAMIVNGKFVINSQFECKAPLSYLEAKLHIDSVLSFANNDRYIVGHRFLSGYVTDMICFPNTKSQLLHR